MRDLELAARSAYNDYRFEPAIRHYREALASTSREADREDWARIQNNLGNALSEQGIRTGGESGTRLLSESVAAYRAALEVFTRDQLPQDWAMTQNNLGIALKEQGIRTGGESGTRLLSEAVAAYRAALEVFTRESLPGRWVIVKRNEGRSLLALDRPTEAAVAFRELFDYDPTDRSVMLQLQALDQDLEQSPEEP